MNIDKIQLARFVKMDDPACVLDEVRVISHRVFPDVDFTAVEEVFADTRRLFAGEFPGFRGCNTGYHDLKHTTDSFLAMARLMHGAVLQGRPLSRRNMTLGLVATLLHDAGYMQELDDNTGTGAKYTLTHVQRSIVFMDSYLAGRGCSREEIENCSVMCKCTGLSVKLREISFSSPEVEMLGKMLGTADLIGQMADRTYLEKLLILFYEFKEGQVPGYESEFDLLAKSIDFFGFTRKRLDNELGGVAGYMRHHFKERWDLDADMYAMTMERNCVYLKHHLEEHPDDYRNYLRRGGYVEQLRGRNG